MIQFRYISAIPSEEFNSKVVIPCKDQDGLSCVLIKNTFSKINAAVFSTDNLEFKLNVKLTNDSTSEDFYFHIIKVKKTDSYSDHQFEILYEYIFNKITSPVSDNELSQLISTLEEYFKTTPEKDRTKFQIGVYGELFTMLFLYNNGYPEIVDKFHTNFFSKHDVEINEKIRLEIKTAAGNKRIHTFKHDQICRDDIDVYISSVMLEIVKKGVSLLELFKRVHSICGSPDLLFALEKLKIRCGINENAQGINCSFDLAVQNIKFYDANDVPHLSEYQAKVDGLSNIKYDVDCEQSKNLVVADLIKKFRV